MSHRDIARSFERGVRRAAVPVAFSAGFSPHPRISWVGAAPTGASSEAEYVELGLRTDVDPEWVRLALDAALPPGLDVTGSAPASSTPLADLIDASHWCLTMPGVRLDELRHAAEALLARDSVVVERVVKDGRRRIDVRQAVVRLVCRAENDTCAILELVVRHTTPAVRPDDVLTALSVVAAFRPPAPPTPHRVGQGRLREDGSLADPLRPDRDDAGRLVARHEV
jgi:radical SAM-linked protein